MGELIKTKQAGETMGSQGSLFHQQDSRPSGGDASAFHFTALANAAASLSSWAEMC